VKQKEASPPPFIKNPKYLLDGFRRGRACSSRDHQKYNTTRSGSGLLDSQLSVRGWACSPRNHQIIKTTRKGVGSTPPVLKKYQVTHIPPRDGIQW